MARILSSSASCVCRRGSGPFPLAVVIHGGCWVARLRRFRTPRRSPTRFAMRGLRRGTSNTGASTIPVADGRARSRMSQMPSTGFGSSPASIPIDLSRVVTIGHSAGAHLALWAAARGRLRRIARSIAANPLPLRAAVALGGPGDLRDFYGQARGILRHERGRTTDGR